MGGDVFQADFTKYSGADFVIGGSPCTYWSIAQSNAKREVKAEGNGWELFMQYVRAISEIRPRYFIYENNKSMAECVKKAISQALGVEPILINSALVSAQFRQRYYWVGVLEDGVYRQADIPHPLDRGILLKDVLDGSAMADKSHAIIGSIGRTTEREYFEHNQGEMTAEPIGTMCKGEKAMTLKAQYSKSGVANFTAEGWSTRGATGVCIPLNTTFGGDKSLCLTANYHRNGVRNLCVNSAATGCALPMKDKEEGVYCV